MSERMREDVILYDRLDILFSMPYLGESGGSFYGKWEDFRNIREQKLLEKYVPYGIYYATFRPNDIKMPDEYSLHPYSLLHRAFKKNKDKSDHRIENLWKYYSTESFYDHFERDYLNRQLCSHFLLRYGQYLFIKGDRAKGLMHVRNASRLGHNDAGIQSGIKDFIREHGLK
jgi:hypothetical protein